MHSKPAEWSLNRTVSHDFRRRHEKLLNTIARGVLGPIITSQGLCNHVMCKEEGGGVGRRLTARPSPGIAKACRYLIHPTKL